MDEAKRTLIQGWLTKAQRDLATAVKLAEKPNPLLDTAIYHCQQAAEKAIKAFLLFTDQVFDRTHDVRVLTALAEARDARFADWLEAAQLLTPYATAFRYPLDLVRLEPEQDEFDQALQAAASIYKFTLLLLPSETHPASAAIPPDPPAAA